MCAWRLLGGAPPPELGPVLPPEPVPPSSKERKYIEKVLEESRRVLDADLADFRCVQRSPGFQVFARPVAPSPSGCGSGKGLTMARLEAEVPVGPDALFELMTSMTGKCIVDPFPKEHHSELVRPLKLPKGDARVVYSEAPRFAGLLRPREYVTADLAATQERLFVCKSCEVEEGPLAAPKKGMVRANLLFAMRMRKVEGQPGRCHMQMVNWLDLGRDTVPPWLANTITERWYFQALVRRLTQHIRKHRLASAS